MYSRKPAICFGGLIIVFLIGCGGNEALVATDELSPAVASVLEENSPPAQTNESDGAVHVRRIIRNGELRFKTSDRSATWTTICSSIKRHAGYIADERQYQQRSHLETTVVLRVPSEHFESMVEDISSGVAHFDTKQMLATEVTAQFVDLEARLKVKKAACQRMSELLNAARSVDEILKIEKQITELQESIESAEGRLRLLNNQVAFSTLTVTFYEQLSDMKPYFITRLLENLRLGWIGAQEVALAFVALWPLIVASVVGFLLFRRMRTKPSTPRTE